MSKGKILVVDDEQGITGTNRSHPARTGRQCRPELRTPLATIKGSMEGLFDRVLAAEAQALERLGIGTREQAE